MSGVAWVSLANALIAAAAWTNAAVLVLHGHPHFAVFLALMPCLFHVTLSSGGKGR